MNHMEKLRFFYGLCQVTEWSKPWSLMESRGMGGVCGHNAPTHPLSFVPGDTGGWGGNVLTGYPPIHVPAHTTSKCNSPGTRDFINRIQTCVWYNRLAKDE
jgi:hypothetical protein